uniref:TnsD family Tn7-like transposition protein n=1 Tax=Microcoleus asticus TaxID=2815231 RepID=UPI001FE65D28
NFHLTYLFLTQVGQIPALSEFRRGCHPASFGTGPWLCLNRTASHFRQPVIEECEITYSQEHGKPIGTFCCTCGFSYCRTGPDRTEEDRLRITKIRAFGSIWENTLRELWQDPTFSLRGISRQLGVDPTTVKLHAATLSLDFPRHSKRQTNQSQRKLVGSESKKQAVPEITLEKYRSEWLTARKNNPEAGRNILRKQFQRVYTWLLRHDREWLEAHLPAIQQKAPPPARVDWESRDTELAESIKLVAANLYSKVGKPTQITTAAIARELGQLALIQKHLDKLPLTAKILADLVETRETFAVRRIQWVVECYRQEGICPQRWQLVRRAGLRPEVELLPSVQNAINQALDVLKQIPHQHGRDCPPQRMAL